MQPHQQRVVDEKIDLDGKIEKLESFTTGQVFVDLADDEKDRLSRQLSVMKQYAAILGERIAVFSTSTQTIVP